MNIDEHLQRIKQIEDSQTGEGRNSAFDLILNDRYFLKFLKREYPSVYDFFINCEHSDSYVPTAAVAINHKTGIPVLLLNPSLVSYFLDRKNFDENNENKDTGYHFLAKILLHEMLHIVLKHFRRRFNTAMENKLYNYAADIIIDNFISAYTDNDVAPWRNWKELLSLENLKTLNGQQFSVDYNNQNYVLNFSDIYILNRMLELPQEEQEKIIQSARLIDNHIWAEGKGDILKGKTEHQYDSNRQSSNGDKQQRGTQEATKDEVGKRGGDSEEEDDTSEGETEQQHGSNRQTTRGDKQDKSTQEATKEETQEYGSDSEVEANQEHDLDSSSISNESGQTKQQEYEGTETNELPQRDEETQTSQIPQESATNSFIDSLLNRCRGGQTKLDKLLVSIHQNKYYDWKNKLRRYIPMISSHLVTYTWKKVNRRLPGLVPGVKRKLKPGSVLIVFDVSGSMHSYYERGTIGEIVNTIYVTFMEIAKINLLGRSQGQIYAAEVDDKMIGEFRKFKSIDELRENKQFYYGGGTDYKDVFTRILNEWYKIEPGKRIPDLTIFITDFDVELDFLKDYKYSIFEGRLLWLRLGGSYLMQMKEPEVPRGEVIQVYPE